MIKVKRTETKLIFNKPIYLNEEIEEELFWKDLYIYSDLIGNNPDIIYLHDTRYNRIYWGYVGNKEFEREGKEEEKEILKQL